MPEDFSVQTCRSHRLQTWTGCPLPFVTASSCLDNVELADVLDREHEQGRRDGCGLS